ncbi:MAG: hypothetical protein ACTJLL_03185 [Anaplasma sp.]
MYIVRHNFDEGVAISAIGCDVAFGGLFGALAAILPHWLHGFCHHKLQITDEKYFSPTREHIGGFHVELGYSPAFSGVSKIKKEEDSHYVGAILPYKRDVAGKAESASKPQQRGKVKGRLC